MLPILWPPLNYPTMPIRIGDLATDKRRADEVLDNLVSILRDSITNNYSIGFLASDSDASLRDFWANEIQRPNNLIICAWDENEIVGTVIITRESRTNGLHRGEFRKLLVHSSNQRMGIGTSLEAYACEAARNLGLNLLYLDSATDYLVEKTYEDWGWQRVGSIPKYAAEPSGNLVATTIFYKEL